jgi:hypothetical protein
MSWFKRCNHEFKYYYKAKDYEAWGTTSDYKFFFICPKCKKEICIKDCDILEVYEELQQYEARDRALGITDLPTTSFLIPYALRDGQMLQRLSGNAAYKTRQYFLDTCGVDITIIDNNN